MTRETQQGEGSEAGAAVGAGSAVVVVGAGVSGCACGATLAATGIDVTLVSSALDLVGLPSYGPEVCVGRDCVERAMKTFDALPPVLRDVWVDACLVPEGVLSCVVVDRRRLSVETKRALEGFGALMFRQGLVVGLRAGVAPGGRAAGAGEPEARRVRKPFELETAFGEVLVADAVVLATGLGLGGRVIVGEQEMGGGRYGETPSDRLMESLTALGAEWGEARLRVGARHGATGGDCGQVMRSAGASARKMHAAGTVSLAAVALRCAVGGSTQRQSSRNGPAGAPECERSEKWGAGLPPSPYFGASEPGPRFRAWEAGGASAEQQWHAYPDGLATGEACIVPSGVGGEQLSDGTESRPVQLVRGRTVKNLDGQGRFLGRGIGACGLWVTGRSAGALDYVGSLRSGVEVGHSVAEQLRLARGAGEARGPGDEHKPEPGGARVRRGSGSGT